MAARKKRTKPEPEKLSFDWEKAAKDLWQLLDDIDTLTDACKGSAPDPRSPFGRGMYQRLRRRHQILHSDGYTLTPPGEQPNAQETQPSRDQEE